jgi:hypothetical protein
MTSRTATFVAALTALVAAASTLPAIAADAQTRRFALAAEDTAILRIRAHFTQIERDVHGYRCRTMELQGFSTEGGDLEACFDGNTLRRLTAVYLGESGRVKEHFYFWNDSLEFLFSHAERYTRPLSGKVRSSEEERFYWSGGRLIRRLKGTRRYAVTGADAAKESSEALEIARELVACARDESLAACEAE